MAWRIYQPMPVFLLIGSSVSYTDQIVKCFEKKYTIVISTGQYPTVRSSLANMESTTLYIVPGLSKPERYEIFCLARKNQTNLVSLATSADDGLSPSDRNPFIMGEFNEMGLVGALESGGIAPTTANRRSKNVSRHGIGEVKAMVNTVNMEYIKANSQVACIIKECENRFLRMCNQNQNEQLDKLEACYRSIIDASLKAKGLQGPGMPSDR